MFLKKFNPLRFTRLFYLGTKDRHSLTANRITIFVNILALFGTIASMNTCFQLWQLGIRGWYLINYPIISSLSFAAFLLNYRGYLLSSRIVTIILLNLTSWNALVFFGRTFNGYYLFFVAIVFSIVAFPKPWRKLRLSSLLLSLSGLPLADYFTHHKILPITGLNSDQFPVFILILDTFITSFFLVDILLIESFLSEKNEDDLINLNKNLENLVEKRTALLGAAREEAMAASRAKSRFIANTSHELRTPLGAIIGFVDLLLDTNPSEQERRRYLEIVRRSGSQLLEIVNEVLDLSKIEAQKLEVENQEFDLADLIQDIRALMSLKAESKGLEFSIETIEPLPTRIDSDPLRLKQILMNLIGNAIKFTDRGRVSVKISALNSTPFSTTLQFDVEDTGMGIDESTAQNLFKAFFQADSTLLRKYGGTGLGLALSKSLAELLNGDVVLYKSVLRQGSIFRLRIECKTVHVPAKFTSQTPEELNLLPLQNLNNKLILVVDDSVDNQILVSQFLTHAGAQVNIAENGKKAIEMIESQPHYEAVLMDLQMPVLDGYEATRLLREKGCIIPIIAFTAHAMKEERDKSKDAGFDGYLTKPIRPQQLISALVKVIYKK